MEGEYIEGKIVGAKEPIPLDESEYKEKGSCICKICGKEGKIGTGFFCKMTYQNKPAQVLITNYHIIDDIFVESKNSLKLYINEKSKSININKNKKIIYSSPVNEYDIIIIRLQDGEINNYLKIDENIFENPVLEYRDEPIYILHYPLKDEKPKISFGYGIEKIDENKYDVKHLCNTEEGSSGGPILSAMTNKIIGIHKGTRKNKDKKVLYNLGTFLKFPLDELKNRNEITCKYNIKKNEINLFYDYSLGPLYISEEKSFIEAKNNIIGENIDIYINDKKIEFNYKYKSNDIGEIKVKFKFKKLLTSTSYMFFECHSLNSIDLSSFKAAEVIDMSFMFYRCYFLKSIDLSSFNTTKVKDMSHMFENCCSLNSIDLSSFDTTKVNNLGYIFAGCNSLKSIDLSSFKTTNVNNMGFMFYKCSSLKSIDLSSFNTTNVNNISWMFSWCSSLKSLDLSSFNATNINNMKCIFFGCSSLKKENVKISSYGKKILDKLK